MEFHQKGFPSIQIFEDSFKIKAKPESNWRIISYKEVTSITYDKSGQGWWNLFDVTMQNWFSVFSAYRLEIKTTQRNRHVFRTLAINNPEFESMLSEIADRCEKTEQPK